MPATRLRVFIAVHDVNWEQKALVDPWNTFADVVHYDWGDDFDQYARSWFTGDRERFQAELFSRVERAHAEAPLDLFFSYLSARWVDRATIDTIRRLDIKTVNFSFDDARLFWGPRVAGAWTGVAPIARAFDLNVTVARLEDVTKYRRIGARALFFPPAGNADRFALSPERAAIGKDIPLSFVGQRYGRRVELIESAQRAGVPIQTFGRGWPSGEITHDERMDVYARSLVTLGFAYLGASRRVSMKGRDFEASMTGTCYLTTWEPTLVHLFEPDREMVFYRNGRELVKKARWLINHPDETRQIGERGREKALRYHQWGFRWLRLVEELGIASAGE